MQSSGEQPGERILVVDGHAGCRARIAAILETEGYSCDVARDAEEAAESRRAGDYGLALVDVDVRGIDEWSPVARGELPVILMTPYRAPEGTSRVNGIRVTDCLEKPFTIEELVGRVKDAVVPSTLRRSLKRSRSSLAATLHELERLADHLETRPDADDLAASTRGLVDVQLRSILSAALEVACVLGVDLGCERYGDHPASQALLNVLRETATILERQEGYLRHPEEWERLRERFGSDSCGRGEAAG